MSTRSAQDIWEAALGVLQIQVSKSNYRTWFQNTTGLSYEGDQFVVGVPNSFVGEYLNRNQRSLIEKALIGLTRPDVQVVFQINGKHCDPSATTDTDLKFSPTTLIRAPQLNPNYQFESFIEGSGNRLARAAALSVSQNPGCTYNPLFIYGGVGLGKTHLLHAIGHAALTHHATLICTSAEKFTNEFVSAIRERRTEEFRTRYRNAGMLLIDDIHFISGKEQTEESFYHTFNELHNSRRQIVITSDRPPKEIPRMAERLRSRFEWGLMVDIQPPDFETRLAILQAKAEHSEASICADVLEFIAGQIQRNIRELEGSLNRVLAYSRLLRAVPTIELASQALKDIACHNTNQTEVSPTRLLETAANCFQLDPDDLIGPRRDKEAVMARRVAMYLIRQETNCSLAQIGQLIGGRDAAAVTNACKKVSGDIDNNHYLHRKLEEIQRQIRT